jgi:ActR/RegA family two-component response regulator
MTYGTVAAYALTAAAIPVVIMDDVEQDAANLSDELKKQKVVTHLCKDMQELLSFATYLDKAMFVVDLDMGTNRRQEGLVAIKRLRQLQQQLQSSDNTQSFYIAALTTHAELEQEAVEAGADTFIIKGNARNDALELLLRLSAHSIAVERKWIDPIQRELADREYDNLRRQLTHYRNSKQGLRSCITTVRRALNWPFLLPNELIILSAIDEQLRMAQQGGELEDNILDLCLEGVDILAGDHRIVVRDWIQRTRKASASIIFTWLEGEELDEDEED